MKTRRPFVALRVCDGVESMVGGAFSQVSAEQLIARDSQVDDLSAFAQPAASVRVVSGAPVVSAFAVGETQFAVIRNPNPNRHFEAG